MAALSCTYPGDWGTFGQGRWGAVAVPSRAVLSGHELLVLCADVQ